MDSPTQFEISQGKEVMDSPSFPEPPYSVFLSHSGAQKDFVEKLYHDLKRLHVTSFVDKWSLPVAQKFYPLIDRAAKQCNVAVVVLSEEFLSSKWPMHEVSLFLEAQGSTNRRLQILPLFYQVSCSDLKDEGNRKRWFNAWQQAVRDDDRIKEDSWIRAVKEIRKINGVEFKHGQQSEKQYREIVARKICEVATASLRFDDSKIQGVDRLCKMIDGKFERLPSSQNMAARVVGLHGMGGVGKSTICKMLCNRFSKEFPAKVFYVELESYRSTCDKVLERQKKILRVLTHENADLVDRVTHSDQGWAMLKTHMHKHDVFLALDNVWENSEDEAQRYLETGFSSESLVLVTSRSRELLERLLGCSDVCMAVPDLEKAEASSIFLQAARRGPDVSSLTDEQMSIVEECVDRCHLARPTGGGHYHPLALCAMGALLREKSNDPLKWKIHLEGWQPSKYRNPVFDVIGLSYEDLDRKTKQIFLDVAIFAPCYEKEAAYVVDGTVELRRWLKAVHGIEEDTDVEDGLRRLKHRMILESTSDGGVSMHDLYLEFAKMKARDGEFGEANRCFYREAADEDIVEDFRGSSSLLRVGLPFGRFRSLDRRQLQECSQLRVLMLNDCDRLECLDVGGLESLRSLDLWKCRKLCEVKGMSSVEKLAWLRVTKCVRLKHQVADAAHDGRWSCRGKVCRSSTPLMRLRGLEFLLANKTGLAEVPDLRTSSRLQMLCLRESGELGNSPALETLTALRKLDLSLCEKLRSVGNLSQLSRLQELDLSRCFRLKEVPGLDKLADLESLNLWKCTGLKVLPSLSGLTNLQKLDVGGTKIETIESISGLVHLREFCCPLGLRELTQMHKGLSGLQLLRLQGETLSKAHKSLPNVASFTALTTLELYRIPGLTELPPGFGGTLQLQVVRIVHCENLRGLAHIGPFPTTRRLVIAYCGCVEEIPDLSLSLHMEYLVLAGMGISCLPSYLTTLSKLEVFSAHGCRRLPTRELLLLGLPKTTSVPSALAAGAANSICEDYLSEDRNLEQDIGSADLISCLESLFQHGMEDCAITVMESMCWKQKLQRKRKWMQKKTFDKFLKAMRNIFMQASSSEADPSWPHWGWSSEPRSIGVEFLCKEVATTRKILTKCIQTPTSFVVMESILRSGDPHHHEEELSKCGFTHLLMQHISNQPYRASCRSFRSNLVVRWRGNMSILLGWSEVLSMTLRFSTKLAKELKEEGAHLLVSQKILEMEQDHKPERSEVCEWRGGVLEAFKLSLQMLQSLE